jgi:hypothetical protein
VSKIKKSYTGQALAHYFSNGNGVRAAKTPAI